MNKVLSPYEFESLSGALRRHAHHSSLFRRAADEIDRLNADLAEESRLNGMGGEREAALLATVNRLERQVAVLEATINAVRTAMTAAPLWHEQHRAAWDALRALRKAE